MEFKLEGLGISMPRVSARLADRRGISAVVGVVLLVAIVIALAATVAGLALSIAEPPEEPAFGPQVEGSEANPFGDSDALVVAEDPTAGAEDVRYRIRFEIADSDMEGDSLNELGLSVTEPSDDDGVESMFSGVDRKDIETFELDRVDGGTENISGDVEGSDNWESGDGELEMTLGGDTYTNPSVGDVITVVFGGVDNPTEPGTYEVEVTLNQDEDTQDGTLEILSEDDTDHLAPPRQPADLGPVAAPS